ncbi:YncE family protein [Sphingomonas ginsenosidivorax]|uniref:YncE family protein n=1 Tax=Sphingomonas ginsenosidivorax TaxID=862135 RepID=A0A5C6UBT0_9SPHN|nr:YncE family protein [Sphingomonas ginsenosidivorax]TXC69576.1 YncE family protein [Sphingomonas ginsenosidivorax]
MPLIDRRQGLWMLAGGAVATAALGARAMARATPPSLPAGVLALVEKNAGRIAFYALPDGTRTGTIPLGTQPHEIVADPAGRFAYVGHYGVASWKAPGAGGSQVWVIDLHQRTLARTIDLAPFGRLHAVRMDARGRLYVLSEKDSMLARFDDPARDEAPSRLTPVTGARSHYLVVRRDGARCYVADTLSGAVIMVDPEDMGVAPVRKRIGTAPEGMTLSMDERTLYVIDRPSGALHALDATTLEERARRAMRGEAVRIVTQADGRLIVSNVADKSLSRLDPVTLAEQDRLSLGAGAPGLTLVGETLYASLETDMVAIVDTRAWKVAGSFATGSAPDSALLI